jgi:hypothetical protein
MTGKERPSRRWIAIAGEAPLVAEFAAACEAQGYTVECVQTEGARRKPAGLPKGTRIVRRPSIRSSLAIELTNVAVDAKRTNLALLDRALPDATPLLTSSVTVTVAEQATWIKHPGRLVGIGALPGFLGGALLECAVSELSADSARRAAESFAHSLGK